MAAPGNCDLLPFRAVFGLKISPGRATIMAITQSRGPKTCGIFDHRMRNFALFDFASRTIC